LCYTGDWRTKRKLDAQRKIYNKIYTENGIDEKWIKLLNNLDEGVYMGILMDIFIEEHKPKRYEHKVCCEVSSSSAQFYQPKTATNVLEGKFERLNTQRVAGHLDEDELKRAREIAAKETKFKASTIASARENVPAVLRSSLKHKVR
jgi:hypothetical protein